MKGIRRPNFYSSPGGLSNDKGGITQGQVELCWFKEGRGLDLDSAGNQ